MLDLGHHAACQDLRIGEDLVVVEHRSRRNAFLLQRRHPVVGRALHDLGLQDADDLFVVPHPVGIGLEARIVGEFGLADHGAQLSEEVLLRPADGQPAVGRLEHLVGRGAAMPLPELLRPDAVGEVVGRLVDAQRHGGFEQRGLDPLALARPVPRLQRAQHADGEIETGADVGDGEWNAIGWAVLRAGDRHQSRHRLDDEVEAAAPGVWAGLAEARDRAQDQPLVAGVQRLPPQAQPLHHARTEVLQHDIGAVDQVPEDLEILLVLQVELQAALVPVPQHERRRLALEKGRRTAHRIALGTLDLDDVGAHVRELHAAERAGEMGR